MVHELMERSTGRSHGWKRRGAALEYLTQRVHRKIQCSIRAPRLDLKGADRVCRLVDHVAGIQRIEDSEKEIEIHFDSCFEIRLREPAGLLEQEHAEAVESGVAQRQAVF